MVGEGAGGRCWHRATAGAGVAVALAAIALAGGRPERCRLTLLGHLLTHCLCAQVDLAGQVGLCPCSLSLPALAAAR